MILSACVPAKMVSELLFLLRSAKIAMILKFFLLPCTLFLSYFVAIKVQEDEETEGTC